MGSEMCIRDSIKLSKKGIEKIGEYATHLAEYEELKGHALSIKSRINKE